MWQFFSADAFSLPSVQFRHFSPGSQPNERSVPFTESCGPHSGKLLEAYLINRFVAVFSARQLSHDDAPTARSMAARGNAPGTCPSTCSALQGRTDRSRNPGRCPGLECGGAFSAGIKVVQIRIHEF